jgi:tight adherence protein B
MTATLWASGSAAATILLVLAPRAGRLDSLRTRRPASEGLPGASRQAAPGVAADGSAVRRFAVGDAWPARFSMAGGMVVVGVVVLGRLMATGLVVAAVLAAVRGLRRRARRRAAAAARRARVIEACGVLASDLRAGRVPGDALASAATICPELGPAASAARLGDDVSSALDRAAMTPGAAGLRALGAGWRVAEQSGAALAGVAERIADSLRGEEQVRRQVVAGLAGTRATGRLLAGLPILGLGLGYAVGAHPIGFLTGTPIGWFCLTVGLVLAGAGMVWIERLADSCEADLR